MNSKLKIISKKSVIFIIFFVFSALSLLLVLFLGKKDSTLEDKFVTGSRKAHEDDQNEILPETVFEVPEKYEITQKTHTYQTFNNCGPATLSMALSYYGINVDQNELGSKMRPYQIPKGDNDDKTIFTNEFLEWAKIYGRNSNITVINLPNGDIELLKLFISNDIPVIAKMWLNSKEDIGHFVIALGYDDKKQIITKDDS